MLQDEEWVHRCPMRFVGGEWLAKLSDIKGINCLPNKYLTNM